MKQRDFGKKTTKKQKQTNTRNSENGAAPITRRELGRRKGNAHDDEAAT